MPLKCYSDASFYILPNKPSRNLNSNNNNKAMKPNKLNITLDGICLSYYLPVHYASSTM